MSEVFIYTRSLEIVISILAGTFLCYLGWRLFQIGLSEKSDLKIEYGKLKLHLFRATPGIFFALFGAAIISGGVWSSAKFTEEFRNKDGTTGKRTITKSVDDEASIPDISAPETKFQQAINFHRNDDIEEAEAIYAEILKMAPVIGQVANNLADIQKNRGEMASALVFANYAAAVFPDSAIFQKTLRQLRESWSNK